MEENKSPRAESIQEPIREIPEEVRAESQYQEQQGFKQVEKEIEYGKISLILGITAFLLSLIPIIGYVVYRCIGNIAIAFGIISLIKKKEKAKSIFGIIFGVLALIISIIILIIISAMAIPMTPCLLVG